MKSSGLLAVSTGAIVTGCGSTTVPLSVEYRGARLHDVTGDAVLHVYSGVAATAANLLDVLACTDETQCAQSSVPESIEARGLFYVLAGTSAEAVIHFGR